MRGSRWLEVGRHVAAVARERQISVKSAGLAYHAFNTLVPLVILVLVGAALVDALEPILEGVAETFGLEDALADADLEEIAGDRGDRIRAALLALAILLWSAARSFQAINSAFTGIYGSREHQSYVESVTTVTLVTAVNTLLATVTIALGVVLVGVVGISLPIQAGGLLAAVASAIGLLVALPLVFFPMYYLFPQTDVSVREVLPGTAFAAVTWAALAVGFRIYIATSESVVLFGIAGAVLLILTWVYLGALCLLIGAVVNAVLAGRVEPGDEWLPPEELELPDR
ncbi:YihY/virulence factor BrkB family protein [Natronococcus roseus]|uniref:YihY/virulence factor BrkB family protein n=1 Tax=Natronococcus roseus TaxID=1052014 RepID=UPI00374CE647